MMWLWLLFPFVCWVVRGYYDSLFPVVETRGFDDLLHDIDMKNTELEKLFERLEDLL